MDMKISLHLPAPQLSLDPYGHFCLDYCHPVLLTSLHDVDLHEPVSCRCPAGMLQG